MLRWIQTRLQRWASRVQQKRIEKLLEVARRLKAQVLERNGGKPIRLSEEQHRRLDALRRTIDPELLRNIDLLADAE